MSISRIALIGVITVALPAAGLLAKGALRQNRRAGFLDRVSTELNLTDRQKAQAKSIFQSEREAARSVRHELRQERKAVQSAIQSGKQAAEIRQLARNEAPALGELAGMRAAAFAKFHAVLTPAQQQKLATLRQEWKPGHEARNRPGNAAENK